MKATLTKRFLLGVLVIIICAVIFVIWHNKKRPEHVVEVVQLQAPEHLEVKKEVIGKSVEGREIILYTYGTGPKHIVFVGGMHGGYEWNSVLLAYKLIDFISSDQTIIPKNLNVTVIPSANPDGLYKVVGKEGTFSVADIPNTVFTAGTGRFNANGVDLNRNFDCKWKPNATWKSQKVSAGTAPFSEPEAVAIRDFTLKHKPEAFVFFHSQANAVYASECENGILPGTLEIMDIYSKSAGYPAVKSFDSYVVTGDAEGWLASIGIPAITVELKTHESIEWEKNLAGIKALLEYFK